MWGRIGAGVATLALATSAAMPSASAAPTDRPQVTFLRVGTDMQTSSAPAGALTGELKKFPSGAPDNPLEFKVAPGTYRAWSQVMSGYGLAAGYCQAPIGAPSCMPALDDIRPLPLSSCAFQPVLNCSLPFPATKGMATVVVFRYQVVTQLGDVAATVERLGPDTQRVMNRPEGGREGWPSEMTPMVFTPTNGQRQIILSGNATWICGAHPGTPALGPYRFAPSDCKMSVRPQMLVMQNTLPNGRGGELVWRNSLTNPIPARAWNHGYDGVFGYSIVQGTDATRSTIYFARHNEHQNAEGVGPNGEIYPYPGTIYPDVGFEPPGYVDAQGRQKHCASSPLNNWEHCWLSFADFVSLAKAPYDATTGEIGAITDLGPILWPSTGYINGPNGTPAYLRDSAGNPICKKDAAGNCLTDALGNIQYYKASTGFGLYGVQMAEDQNYLYVYTSNTSSLEPGRPWGGCLTVARAPKADPRPRNWKWYYNNGFTSPTLPTGFNKKKLLRKDKWLAMTSGKASCIQNSDDDKSSLDRSMTVAKVRGTTWYVGVQERARSISETECVATGYWSSATCDDYAGRTWIEEVTVQYSQDLAHWSAPQVIDTGHHPTDPSASWGWNRLGSQPQIFDRNITTNHVIDANDFYVFGRQVFTQVPSNPDVGAGNSYQLWSAHLRITNGPWGPNPPTQP